MIKRPVRVLIVDDSVFFLAVIKKHLSQSPDLEIVGTASNAYEAERRIKELRPDVVTIDVEMPGKNGIDFVKETIPVNPLPFVLVSSLNLRVFEALDAGAVDFVRKPDTSERGNMESFCNELASKIKGAASATVRYSRSLSVDASGALSIRPGKLKANILAIGASTGGTETTVDILKRLPADSPGTLIVQHMPAGFTNMYAQRVDRSCALSVSEAKNGDRVVRGKALIAPGGFHMTLHKDSHGYYVKCSEGEKVSGHCPSVNTLFHSVADTAGADAIGLILTGMGRDGAEGLLHMRNQGAYTLGQDQESSVVYGMPMEAYKIGAVTTQVPSYQAASAIIGYLNR